MQSVSLEIMLDSDACEAPAGPSKCKDEEGEAPISLLSFYDFPPCASDLVPMIHENICIGGLSRYGLQEVELLLNCPSRGSMFNWEYVAAEFGFSNSRIM
ncbi:unnamed protein product, partial [Gongylonema pulchrum]